MILSQEGQTYRCRDKVFHVEYTITPPPVYPESKGATV